MTVLLNWKRCLLSDPSKKAYAESFGQLRLRPFDDKWNGMHALLRTTPASKIIRRVWITTLAAAAVIFAILFLRPFTDKQTSITVPVSSSEIAMAPETVESAPAVVKEEMPEPSFP